MVLLPPPSFRSPCPSRFCSLNPAAAARSSYVGQVYDWYNRAATDPARRELANAQMWQYNAAKQQADNYARYLADYNAQNPGSGGGT